MNCKVLVSGQSTEVLADPGLELEPLDACAQQVQRDMVEALVPTLDHVKIIHNLLDEKEIQIE
jgi:hypothetical protein